MSRGIVALGKVKRDFISLGVMELRLDSGSVRRKRQAVVAVTWADVVLGKVFELPA